MKALATNYEYEFDDNYRFSEQWAEMGISLILGDHFPGAIAVKRSNAELDRRGSDYTIQRRDGIDDIHIDIKTRREDYANPARRWPKDDLALETWSVVDTKVGWTRDANKLTDYVLWFWTDTGRYFLIPFPPLCQVFTRLWAEWMAAYRHSRQTTPSHPRPYQSECVFVPRDVVMAAVRGWMEGVIPQRRIDDALQGRLFT